MTEEQKLGSLTAKNGFQNEKSIVQKFNNWLNDVEARQWLIIMGYKLEEIEKVEAIIVSKAKTDVQVQILIKLKKIIVAENIQVKLVSNLNGYNQIDKRWIDKYSELWNIPSDVEKLLKLYTGELPPIISNPVDKRRTYVNEFSQQEQDILLKWVSNNKSLIVSDVLKGRGILSAEWMLVAQKINKSARWILKPMNFCLNFFGNDKVVITEKGNIKIGKITMQRKGGDGGRKTAQMLQFKLNPAELFV